MNGWNNLIRIVCFDLYVLGDQFDYEVEYEDIHHSDRWGSVEDYQCHDRKRFTKKRTCVPACWALTFSSTLLTLVNRGPAPGDS